MTLNELKNLIKTLEKLGKDVTRVTFTELGKNRITDKEKKEIERILF